MNQYLINHIDTWLAAASNFVCTHMPFDMTTDQAYEALLECSATNSPAMIAAFQNAVKYLAPLEQHKRVTLSLPDKRLVTVVLNFNPTVKWPVFLLPEQHPTINPEGKFAVLLNMPVRVATEWTSLRYLWEQLRTPVHGLTNEQLVYLMPWIRECLTDFDVNRLPVEVKLKERVQIAKELATVMNDVNVLFFPRLSRGLMDIARSGRTLISQFRMIDAAYGQGQLHRSLLVVEPRNTLIAPWVNDHLTEAMEDWREDVLSRVAREAAALRARDAKRKKDQPNG